MKHFLLIKILVSEVILNIGRNARIPNELHLYKWSAVDWEKGKQFLF